MADRVPEFLSLLFVLQAVYDDSGPFGARGVVVWKAIVAQYYNDDISNLSQTATVAMQDLANDVLQIQK